MNFLKILPLSKRRLDVLFEIYARGEDYLRNISKNLKMNPSLTFNIPACGAQTGCTPRCNPTTFRLFQLRHASSY